LPTSKGPPSSLVQLRIAVWTGDTRDTRPCARSQTDLSLDAKVDPTGSKTPIGIFNFRVQIAANQKATTATTRGQAGPSALRLESPWVGRPLNGPCQPLPIALPTKTEAIADAFLCRPIARQFDKIRRVRFKLNVKIRVGAELSRRFSTSQIWLPWALQRPHRASDLVVKMPRLWWCKKGASERPRPIDQCFSVYLEFFAYFTIFQSWRKFDDVSQRWLHTEIVIGDPTRANWKIHERARATRYSLPSHT
jgi:hypothetical protein